MIFIIGIECNWKLGHLLLQLQLCSPLGSCQLVQQHLQQHWICVSGNSVLVAGLQKVRAVIRIFMYTWCTSYFTVLNSLCFCVVVHGEWVLQSNCLNFFKWFVDSWYTTWLYNERRWWRRRWGSPSTLDSSSLWGWLWSWRASWVPAIMSAPITQTFSLVCCILVVFFNLLHYEKFYENEDLLMKLYVNFHSKVLYFYPWFEKKN